MKTEEVEALDTQIQWVMRQLYGLLLKRERLTEAAPFHSYLESAEATVRVQATIGLHERTTMMPDAPLPA